MGPERALQTLLSLASVGCLAYSFYHLLTTGNVLKIVISAILGLGILVILIVQMRKNIIG